jgi:hypothetical protein
MTQEDFVCIKTEKGSKTFSNGNGLAKTFSTREFRHTSSSWSDDQWQGRTEGGSTLEYLEVTRETAFEDFKNAPKTWKQYRLERNIAFRCMDVVFED